MPKKKPLMQFTVAADAQVTLDVDVTAASAEEARVAAKDQFRRALDRSGLVWHNEDFHCEEPECTMRAICALCGDRPGRRGEDKTIFLDYQVNILLKHRFLDGEVICKRHLEKPGPFAAQVRRLKRMLREHLQVAHGRGP